MYIIGKTANEQNLDKLCSRGTDVPKLYFHIKNVHFSKPNVEYKKKKKITAVTAINIIHRIVQQVHKLGYFPEERHHKCEKAAKFRVSCIPILQHLKVIFEVI